MGDFVLGDFGIFDYDLGEFNFGDFELTPPLVTCNLRHGNQENAS